LRVVELAAGAIRSADDEHEVAVDHRRRVVDTRLPESTNGICGAARHVISFNGRFHNDIRRDDSTGDDDVRTIGEQCGGMPFPRDGPVELPPGCWSRRVEDLKGTQQVLGTVESTNDKDRGPLVRVDGCDI
jgi:hypothetical protein